MGVLYPQDTALLKEKKLLWHLQSEQRERGQGQYRLRLLEEVLTSDRRNVLMYTYHADLVTDDARGVSLSHLLRPYLMEALTEAERLPKLGEYTSVTREAEQRLKFEAMNRAPQPSVENLIKLIQAEKWSWAISGNGSGEVRFWIGMQGKFPVTIAAVKSKRWTETQGLMVALGLAIQQQKEEVA